MKNFLFVFSILYLNSSFLHADQKSTRFTLLSNHQLNAYNYTLQVLQSSKLAQYLNCNIAMSENREKFNFFENSIETSQVKIDFKTNLFPDTGFSIFVQPTSKISFSKINSYFGGLNEQIVISADDEYNSSLTLQHDGHGHITWMIFDNMNMTLPCALKQTHLKSSEDVY